MRVGTVLFVLLLAAAAAAGPHGPRFFGSRKPVSPKAETPAAAADAFRTTVRPILATRCAPCHNPGGRMYARLPFDDPQVVSSHSPGVLRRLKGDDREAMVRWLSGLAPSDAAR